jgi:hypothetical protein
LPSLDGDHAEQMQRIEVAWLLLQNFFVDTLRFRELSPLMQAERMRETVWQRGCRRISPVRLWGTRLEAAGFRHLSDPQPSATKSTHGAMPASAAHMRPANQSIAAS